MYRLYHEFADRYDLHTPPDSDRYDRSLVLEEARRVSPACRLLDVGCGTGVLIEEALAAGIDGYGIDSSPEMVEVARRRVGEERVRVERMQEISEVGAYDLVCSLSWPIHYCRTAAELADVLDRCRRALRPGGRLMFQVADDERMDGSPSVELEPGPAGEAADTLFSYRFRPLHDAEHRVIAEYVYVSRTHGELLSEEHELRFASPPLLLRALRRAGFLDVGVVETASPSPFVVGTAGERLSSAAEPAPAGAPRTGT